MTRVLSLLAGLGLAALSAVTAAAAPLEAYGKLPTIETVALSAAGSRLAVIVTNGEERRILVKDLAAGKILLLANAGRTKVRALQWAGEDHVIVTSSVTAEPRDLISDRAEWAFASDVDLTTKKVRRLLEQTDEKAMNTIASLPVIRTVDGKTMIFVEGITFPDRMGVVSLFRIEVGRPFAKLLEVGQPNTRNYVVGPDGGAVAQSQHDRSTGRWSLKVKTPNGGWREVLTRNELDSPHLVGLGRDGHSVVVDINEREGGGWREIALDVAAPGQSLPTVDDQEPIVDRATGRLIGSAALVGDEARYTFFNPADERAWKAVVKAFGGARVSLVSWSNDRTRIVVKVDSDADGPAYALADLKTHKANWIGAEYNDVAPPDIGPVKAVHFKAADGLDLSGYLTLPRGRDPKSLPLIVFPHGGPAARDTPGFNWWAQAMASRGYAVLQVNFRGSAGFGGDFLKAGFGQWGRKMQTDLSDGVRELSREGVVDPKRVCIVGGSYGGYAALAGATLEKGVYRCAVSFGGVTDLRRMVAYDEDRGGRSVTRYWTRFMGAKDLDDPVLAKYSPALHAADADVPILLIHGKDDTVVPLAQSQEMADALRKAGKPVELVIQNHADHWLSLGDTRLQMLQATMAFVEKNNPPN